MTHLLILCEGYTEKRILKSFLRPYWQTRFHSVEIQPYSGNGELRTNFKSDAETYLSQEPDASVLCLVDMYREPFALYRPSEMTVEQGFKFIQDHMYKQIKSQFHRRFGAFPVVTEIETWLLADRLIQNDLNQSILEPETIAHPTAFLENIYSTRNKQYGKIIDGADLFGKADARRVFDDNCPHFNTLAEWIINPPAPPSTLSEIQNKALEEWEKTRDAKYMVWQTLEQNLENEPFTETDLQKADDARSDYESFVQTRHQIFHKN